MMHLNPILKCKVMYVRYDNRVAEIRDVSVVFVHFYNVDIYNSDDRTSSKSMS